MMQKGDLIRKNNWEMFGDDFFVIQIKKMRKHNALPGTYYVNGKYMVSEKTVSVISQEEADDVNFRYGLLEISPTGMSAFSCIRGDNREEKIKYSTEEKAKRALFVYVNRFPWKPFDLYKCGHCDSYHIGKNYNFTTEKIVVRLAKVYFDMVVKKLKDGINKKNI